MVALDCQVKVLKTRVHLHASVSHSPVGAASQSSSTFLMTKNQEDTKLVIAQHT